MESATLAEHIKRYPVVVDALPKEPTQVSVEDIMLFSRSAKLTVSVRALCNRIIAELQEVRVHPRQLLRIDTPADSLTNYLRTFHLHTLFYNENTVQANRFFGPLKNIIAGIQDEYGKLDDDPCLSNRRDGSTRFSHAWETMVIMLEDFRFLSKESILAALLHDYFEDALYEETNLQKSLIAKKATIRNLLRNASTIHVDRVIDMIEHMTKKPLEAYAGRMEKIRGKMKDPNFLQILKGRRVFNYYGQLEKYDLETFVIKCADRYHSLTHFDNSKKSEVEKKILETERYFIPELNRRIRELQQRGSQHEILLVMRILGYIESQMAINKKVLESLDGEPYRVNQEKQFVKNSQKTIKNESYYIYGFQKM